MSKDITLCEVTADKNEDMNFQGFTLSVLSGDMSQPMDAQVKIALGRGPTVDLTLGEYIALCQSESHVQKGLFEALSALSGLANEMGTDQLADGAPPDAENAAQSAPQKSGE